MFRRQRLVRGPDRIGWQHKARVTETLADLSPMVSTLDAYRQSSSVPRQFKRVRCERSMR
jgi:hypothetical protein